MDLKNLKEDKFNQKWFIGQNGYLHQPLIAGDTFVCPLLGTNNMMYWQKGKVTRGEKSY